MVSTGTTRADDQEFRSLGLLDEHLVYRSLYHGPVDDGFGSGPFQDGQDIFEMFLGLSAMSGGRGAREEWMIRGFVGGAAPGAYGDQFAVARRRLDECETGGCRRSCGVADSDDDAARLRLSVRCGRRDHDDRAVGPARDGETHGPQEHAGDPTAAPGAEDDQGCFMALAHQRAHRILGLHVGDHLHLRVETTYTFLRGCDEMLGEDLLGRTPGVEGGTHAFVVLPQRRMDDAQGKP